MSADRLRMRMAELNKEIEALEHEMNERESKGKPVHDLEKKLETLEREKHELVEQIQDLWSV